MDGIRKLFAAIKSRGSLQKAETLKPAKWAPLSDEQINQEYEWEYPHVKRQFGDIWPTVDHFRQAVKGGKVTPIDDKTDAGMSNRSHTRSLDELKGLVSTYRYPRDVDRIANGFKAGDTMPTPIVLRHPETGHHHIMSGNTRMDTSRIMGYQPHATVVDMPAAEKVKKSLANSNEPTESGDRWKSVFIAARKGKMEKSEALDKGGAMKRFPYNPAKRPMSWDRKFYGWQDEAKGPWREKLPKMEGNARERALHKLSAKTKTVIGADGKRYYLLHRGMSPAERSQTVNVDDEQVSHKDKKSSWTPDYDTARHFSSEYGGGVTSAWVHENDIHTVPNQFGAITRPVSPDSWDAAKMKLPKKRTDKGRNSWHSEYEVVLRAGHKSHRALPERIDKYKRQEQLSGLHERINSRGKMAREVASIYRNDNDPRVRSTRTANYLQGINQDIKYAQKKHGLVNEVTQPAPEIKPRYKPKTPPIKPEG